MKKIFILLSVLTISGSAIPTTIAANLYQKEEKLNIDVNNLVKYEPQKDNIIRSKRNPNDEKIINKIKNTSLGRISNKKNNTILQAIARVNPSIDISNLRVSVSFLSYALIADGTGDTIFVNYITPNIDSSVTFRESIQNTNLGILTNTTDWSILSRFIELNPSFQRRSQSLFISEIRNNNAQISNKKDKKDKVYVNFNVHKERFYKRFTTRNLGILTDIDENLIKNKIIMENPDIDEDELEITNIEEIDNNLRVSLISIDELNSQNFNVNDSDVNNENNNLVEDYLENNEVVCTFKIPEIQVNEKTVEKENIIINTNLGILPNNNADTILQAIARFNPHLDIENLVFLNIGQRSARVEYNEGTSASASLSVLVYFSQQNQEVEFCNLIRNINLGELKNDNNNTIKRKIASLVPDVNKEKISIVSRTPTKIVIKSPKGKVCVVGKFNFNVRNNNQTNRLESIIINRNLGEINDNSDRSILRAIAIVNPGINIRMLMVESASENSAIIIGRLRSPYQGSVVVNFTINQIINNREKIFNETASNFYHYASNCPSTSKGIRRAPRSSINKYYCKNSTIMNNKINTYEIAGEIEIANLRVNRAREYLKIGDIYIGTTDGLYFLRNNILKKVRYAMGNIIKITFKSRALIAETENGTIYQVDYDENKSTSWLSGPTPPWSVFNNIL